MKIKQNDKIEFSRRLNKVLDDANFAQIGDGRAYALAKIFKITPNATKKWLDGESIPRYEKILEIIERFEHTGVTAEWLITGQGSLKKQTLINDKKVEYWIDKDKIMAWKVPVISWEAVGVFDEIIQSKKPIDDKKWVATTTKPMEKTFALIVNGDSMSPTFTEGMIITVEPDLNAIPGDYVIAKNGNEATFKQLVKDGNDYYLKPINERYPIKPLDGMKIIGVVREAIKKIR